MAGSKETISAITMLLSDTGDEAHFLYRPGPPPQIEFGRSKFSPTGEGAVIGKARRQGDTIYLAPKSSKDLKERAVTQLQKALKSKLSGVTFALGAAPAPVAPAPQDDNDDDRSEDTSHLKAKASAADVGDPQVAAVMARIMKSGKTLMARNDLPPQLAQIQAILNKANETQKGNPKQLIAAFQKLRVAAMSFDAEREAAQTASTSDYGNVPQGQDPDMQNLPPLPQTPDEAQGAYGNVPKGPQAVDQDQGPLPDIPVEEETADDEQPQVQEESDYGDLPLAQAKSDTGYDDTYQDLELVPKPDDTDDDDAAAPATASNSPQAQGDNPYQSVTADELEAYRLQKVRALEEIEDTFDNTIKATIAKIQDQLDGTDYAPGTKNHANVSRGIARFQELAEGIDPDLRHLTHIMRELRKEIVKMIKAIKAKSAV